MGGVDILSSAIHSFNLKVKCIYNRRYGLWYVYRLLFRERQRQYIRQDIMFEKEVPSWWLSPSVRVFRMFRGFEMHLSGQQNIGWIK